MWTKFFIILKLVPAVVHMVREIEAAIPGPNMGKHKLDIVLNGVETAAAAEPEIEKAISAADLQSAVTSIAGGTVATLKAAGVFK